MNLLPINGLQDNIEEQKILGDNEGSNQDQDNDLSCVQSLENYPEAWNE